MTEYKTLRTSARHKQSIHQDNGGSERVMCVAFRDNKNL